MKYRKLQIAWSAFFGIAAVLVIVLWVRSYRKFDIFDGRHVCAATAPGLISFVVSTTANPNPTGYEWDYYRPGHTVDLGDDTLFGFKLSTQPHGVLIIIPAWFAAVSLAATAAIPFIRSRPKQFSLRTLLIVTMLVAAALGLIVWAAR